LDSIQAGILSIKMKYLSSWNKRRQEAAKKYDELLSSVPGIITPYCPDCVRAVFHLYVVRVEDREGLQKHLNQTHIGTGIHYPVPLHLQKAYEYLGHKKGEFPISEKAAAQIVSLPIFPQITAEQQRRVVDEISRFPGREAASEKVSACQI